MNKTFWKNKNVLVTGYEGFLGSNLTKRLISCGSKVIGLDIKVRRKFTILTGKDYRKLIIIKGNVINCKLLREIVHRYKIEIIFHLAAEATVGKCLRNPSRTFSSNIRGTWNVLETCRSNKIVKAIIIASSDKAYGSSNKLPYKEDAPLSGNHPYDVSKSCADLICRTFFHTYNLPVGVTRCGNIYGQGDFNFSRIIPGAIKSAILNKRLLIRSDGKFTRDYVYVEDVVDGYILLAEKMQKIHLYGKTFNFSNENPITVINMVKNIYRLVNRKPNYKILANVKYEIKHQYLSSKKARKILCWIPNHTLEEGLKKTIEWYRNYFNKLDL